MLTQDTDRALDAMEACKRWVPLMRAHWRQGSSMDEALARVLEALNAVDEAWRVPVANRAARG